MTKKLQLKFCKIPQNTKMVVFFEKKKIFEKFTKFFIFAPILIDHKSLSNFDWSQIFSWNFASNFQNNYKNYHFLGEEIQLNFFVFFLKMFFKITTTKSFITTENPGRGTFHPSIPDGGGGGGNKKDCLRARIEFQKTRKCWDCANHRCILFFYSIVFFLHWIVLFFFGLPPCAKRKQRGNRLYFR